MSLSATKAGLKAHKSDYLISLMRLSQTISSSC